MKHIIVKTHTADKTIGEVRVITKDGQPTVIKADRNVNYEFFHEEINAAPNHIITKRVGDDLHVSFEREGAEVDLIIEGFYEYEHNALIGIAENGSYYYYIPDTGEVEDYVTKLKAGEVEGQALGGENVIAPLWLPVPNGFAFPWWALIPLVPLLFIDKDGDPEPTSPVSTNADEKAGTFNELTKSNNPVTQNIMGNDKGIDVNSLRLIDPVSGTHTYKVIVPGQGVWELKAGTDEVTFTPEKGFLANPTPINYYAVGTNGSSIESTPVSVQYPSKTTADRSIGETGKPKSVHVVSNDDNTIDPTTVRLVDPNSPTDSPIYTDKLVVPGEGTWTVDKDANGVPTGYVTFTPEKGFTGDPTPIHYVVNTKPNSDGTTEQLLPTPVSIEYPTHPVADFKVGSKGQPVIQNVTQNDGNQGKDVDPTSVQLIDPKNPNTPTDKVVVAGQGVWTLKVGTDEVTFTPEAGFTGTPTPIFYIVNDTTGVTLPKTTVGVAYPDVLDTTPKPDFKTGVPGQPVTQKVISNDGNGGDNIDPTSVQLIDPKTGTPSTSVTVPNEGVWTTTPTGDVTFTPNKGFNGDPTPISYTVKDKDGNTLPTTTVDVGYPSTQLTPMPTPDSKTGVPGQPVTQNVTSNDGDNGKDVDPSSVKLIDPKTGTPGTSVTVPNEGVWTTTPTGDVTFTPNKDFTGDPTPITYTVTDKNGNTLPTTPVDVNYPKEVPTPMPTPDSKTGVPGQPVTQNVISNDGDNGKDIDPTSVKLIDPKTGTPSTSVTVPNEGVWTTTPTGDVTFTPNKDFTGDPTPITYTVTDKNGNTLPQTPVDVNYPTSTPTPTPTPDSKTGVPGQPVTQNVTSNDGDNGKDIDPSSVKLIDPKTGTPGTSVTVPNEGVWTTTPTGDVTFTPNKDFTGDPTPITYTVTDKDGNTLPKTPVDVNYPTSKPTPTPTPDSKTGVPGQPVTQNVTSNDGDNGKDVDPTSVKLIDPKTGTPGTSVTVPNEGVWTTTPTGDVTFTPNKDFTGDPTPITYTVTDKNGNTLPQTPVDVNYPTTVPTPIPTPDSKTGVPGQPVTQNVTSNDGDNGKDIDPSSVKLVDPKTGTPGTSVTVPNEGVWTTTPTGDVTFTPNKDFTGDPTPITYTVTDKNGNTLPPTTVDVAYPEKQPTPLPTPDVKEGVPGQPVTQNVTSNDGDNGKDIDPTSVKLIDPITGTPSTSVTVPNEGTWTTTPTGDVTFTPNKDFTGDPTPIPYTVTDKNGNTLPTSTVDVNYPNTSTVSTLPDSKPGERGTPVSQNVLENDGNNIDPTTVQLINPNNPAAGGTDTVVIPNEGTWTVDKDPTTGKPNGSITFTPNPGFEDDPAPINYIAKNPEGVTSKQTPVNVVYPKTPEVIVPDNPPTPANPTGMGDNEVFEGNTAGVQGMFKVVPGLSSATIKEILLANESGTTVMVPLTVSPSAPVTLNTAKGVLTITSYDSTTGDVSYVFVPKVQNHATDAPVLDQISIVVKDSNDRQGYGMLDIAIIDGVPVAENDSNQITEDATPNTVTGSLKPNDNLGTDTANAGNEYTPIDNVSGAYGSFTVDAAGNYTYTLDNTNDTVNKLSDGKTLVDTITYTITDADGDTATAVLTITINGHTDGVPSVSVPVEPSKPESTIPATNPNVTPTNPETPNQPKDAGNPDVAGDDKTVFEGDDAVAGSFFVTTDPTASITSITIADQKLPVGANGITPTTIVTDKGTLTIQSYDLKTGEVKYTYDPIVLKHPSNEPLVDSFPITVEDSNNITASDKLDIAITDSLPAANDDKAEITEDAASNTVTGSLKVNDDFGVDGEAATNPFTPVENAKGQYGSFTIAADGTYTYVLNNEQKEVSDLNKGDTLVDTISYTITDGDGDTSTAILTVTINGNTDGVPNVTVPVDPTSPTTPITPTNPNVTPNNPETPNQPQNAGSPTANAGDKVVFEGDGPTKGDFTVTQDPNNPIITIKVGNVDIPVVGGTIAATPIPAEKGTMTVESYDPATGKVTYTYDPVPQNHPSNEPVTESFPITVTDKAGKTAVETLDIAITDSLPAANDDKAEITEDAASNTVTGSLKVNDDFGVDGEAATNPFTPVENAKGQYGSFTIAADGTYTYVLNNEQKEVSDLNKGDTLVDTISYTITDGDGDTSTAILTVTINGNTDGVPNVTVPVDPTSPTTPITPTNPNVTPNNPETPNQPQNAGSPTANAGDKVVFEGDGPTKGDFTVTQDPNNPIITIKVGNVDIPVVGGTIAATPIPAEKGTMTVESYDPATGKVTYTYDPVPQNHPSNEPVTESFPITVTDKAGKTAVETLDIAITDSLPAANDDKAEITEDAASNTVTGSLKVNDDFGVDGEAATNPFTPVENAKGQYGSFTIAADGTYTYVLNNEQKEVSDLNKGDTLVDTISYTITDGDGDTSTAILTVTINGNTDGVPNVTVPVDPTSPTTPITPTNPNVTPNNPETPNQPQNAGSPTANAGDKVVFEGDGPTKGDFTVTQDPNNPIITIKVGNVDIPVVGGTIAATPIPAEKGTMTVESYDPATGKVTYTYDPVPQNHPSNEPVTESFPITVTDKAGKTAVETLDIAITDSLPAANDDKAEITEDAASNTVTGSLKVNDDFGVDGEAATNPFTPVDNAKGQYGTFSITADGTYTYVLDNAAVNDLNKGDTLVDTISYTITDGDGDTSTAILTVTINGNTDGVPNVTVPVDPTSPTTPITPTNPNVTPNNPETPNQPQNAGSPTANAGDKVVFEGDGPTKGDFTVTQDPNNPIITIKVGNVDIPVVGGTIAATSIPADKGTMTVESYDPATGKVTYTYDPVPQEHPSNEPVTESFPITVTDKAGKTAVETLDIAITDSLPAANDDKAEITEDAASNTVTGSLKVNDDFGVDGEAATNPFTPVENAKGQYGSFTIAADGTYTYVLNNEQKEVSDLNKGDTLVDTISYTITDGDGDTSTAILTVTINGNTDGVPNVTVPVDPTSPTTPITPTNPNVTPNNPETPNQPQNAGSPTANAGDKVVFEGDGPTKGDFTVTQDPNNPIITIKVGNVDIPVVGGTIAATPIPAEKGTMTVESYDPATGKVTYTYDPVPQEHPSNEPVTESFPITVTDKAGKTAVETLDIAITDSLPAANDDKAEITEDAASNTVTGSLKVNDDFGVDGEAATNPFTPVENAKGQYGSFTIAADGTYTYVLNNEQKEVSDLNKGDTLVDTISYTITDGDGDTSTAILTVTINGNTDGVPNVTVPVDPTSPTTPITPTNPNVTPNNPETPNQPQNAGSPTANAGDKVVFEGDGPTKGDFTVTQDPNNPIITIKVGNVDIPVVGGTIAATSIPADKGTMTVESYDPATGKVTYTYDPVPQEHPSNEPVTESFPITVTDKAGKTAVETLDIAITDSLPAANDDKAEITEDAASNTVTGSLKVNDDFGVDGEAATNPFTPVDNAKGQYGTFSITADGTYTYVLDNAAVNDLNKGDTLVDTISYTITDGDGDTSTAILTVTINGNTDGVPNVTVPVDPTSPTTPITPTNPNVTPNNPETPNQPQNAGSPTANAGDKVVFEGDGPTKGDFTVTQDPNNPIITIKVGNVDIPVVGGTIAATPIPAEKGTMTVESYDPATGKVTYTYDPVPQEHPSNEPVTESFPITVTDKAGKTAVETLDIAITDSLPAANDDKAEITEDAASNTVTGSLKVNDDFGVDGEAATNPFTPVENAKGQYGSFTIAADGTYTYVLNNEQKEVSDLNKGDTLVDTISYTITDGDGDTSTAILTVTINGNTDGVPNVTVPVDPTSPTTPITPTNPNVTPNNPETPNQPQNAGSPTANAGDKVVFEGDGPTKGDFTVTQDPNNPIITIKVGNVDIPVVGGTIAATPIPAEKGTMTVESYDPATGKVTYTYDPVPQNHPSNEPVTESFPITVTDKAGKTAVETLDIAITDSLPAANDDKAEITEDAASNTVTGSLKVNDDFGVDGEAATNPFTPVENAKGQYGSFTIAADGTYTYVLNNEQKEVSDLNKGDTLVDTISYTITDGDGDTSTAILTVTINGNTDGVPNVTVPVDPTSPTTPITPTNPNVTPNNPETPNQPQNAGSPTANAGDKVVFEGDGPTKGDFTVTQDPNNPIITIKVGNVDIPVVGGTIAATPIPAEKGTMTVESYDPATGKVTYTYDPVPQNHPSNEPVTESFPITVTDKAGKTAVETLDIAITDSLPAANDDKAEITEDAASNTVTGSLKVNDDFGVDGEAATNPFTPVENAKGQYGSFTIAADGTYTYVLNNEQKEVSDLNKGDTLVDTISYTITDGDGDTSTAILTVTINGNTDGVPNVTVPVDPTSPTTPITPTNPNVTPNNPETPNQPQNAGSPTANAGDKVVFEGDGPTKGDFTVTQDPNNPIITIKVGNVDIPVVGGTIAATPIPAEKGTMTVESYDPATGKVTYTYDPVPQNHPSNEPVTESFPITVTDKAGKTAVETLDIAITDSLPAANDDKAEITEDAASNTVTGSLKVNDDFGVDGEAATNPFTPVENAKGQYGSFTIAADGTYTYVLNNEQKEVSDLNKGDTLVDTISYTITDGDGDTSTAILTVTINGNTDGEPNVTVPNDPTKPSTPITPTNPNVTPTNPETPNQPKDEGSPNAAVRDKVVFEGDGPTQGEFTVTKANNPIKSIEVGGVVIPVAGGTIASTPIPADKGTMTVESFDPATGKVTYTYDPVPQTHGSEPLVESFPIKVTDTGGGSAVESLDIEITDSLPAANDDKAEITEDAASNTVTGSLKVNDDFGVDGEAATNPFTPVENAQGQYGSFTIAADGTYTYVLNNEQKEVSDLNKGETLVDTISYTITDGDGDTSTAVLTVTINGNTDGEPNVTVPNDPTKPSTPITPTNPNVTPTNPETPNQPKDEGSPNAAVRDKVVFEGDGPTQGEFTVTKANNPIKSIEVGGVVIPVAGGTIASTPIPADKGTMTVESFDPATGKVTYTYDPVPQTHGSEPLVESFPIKVTDTGGGSAVESLDIEITDSLPAANDDKAEITEDAASNTVTGSLKVNDDFGVDGEAATNPFTPVENAKGQYGSFTIAADGTYTYVLNNEQKEVSDLNKGDTLVDTISYTITDGDGDTSTAVLTVTINGNTDGEPNVTVPNDPTKPSTPITPTNPNVTPTNPETPNQPKDEGSPNAAVRDKVVFEGDGPTQGEFTVTKANNPIKSIEVGGVVIPVAGGTIASTPIPADKGTMTVESFDPATGKVTYTYDPVPQTHGSEPLVESFPIKVTDTGGGSAVESLDIEITDSLPAANDDKAEITEDAKPNSVTGKLNVNDDFGVDGQPTPNTGYTEVANQPGEYGSFTIAADGTYTYVLNNENEKVNALNRGETLVDTITYTIEDKDGDKSTAVLTVTIQGRDEPGITVTNDPSRPTNPQSVETPTVPEGTDKVVFEGDGPVGGTFTVKTDESTTITTINVGGTAIPVEGGTIKSTPINTPKGGTLVVESYDPTTGEVKYTYDPTPQDHKDPSGTPNNTPVMDSINVQVTDGNGNSAVSTIDIAITDSVPLAVNDATSITEDATPNSVTGSLKPNDNFGADGEAVQNPYTPVTNQAGQYGSFKIDANGDYTYTLDNNNAAVNALGNGATLIDTITYTIQDKDGDTATAILTVTINGVTDELALTTATHTLVENAPETTGETYVITYKAAAGMQTLTVNGQELAVNKVITTDKGSLKILTMEEGKVTYAYTPKVLQHTTNGETEVDTFAVVLTDRTGAQATQNVVVNITDTTPTAANDVGTINEKETSVTGKLDTNDNFGADGQPAPNTGYTPVDKQAGQYGSFTIGADGQYTYTLDKTNAAVGALNTGDTLTDTIVYTITDKDGDTATATLTITINGDTNPSFSLVATDPLAIEGNTANNQLVFTVDNNGATLTDKVTGKVKLDTTASSKTLQAADVQTITVQDANGTRTVTYEQLVNGIDVVTPQDGTKPTITIVATDDNVYERSEDLGLTLSDVAYVGKPTEPLTITKANDKGVIADNEGTPDNPDDDDKGDKPIVNLSGPATVSESVGNAEYTFTMVNPVSGQPATSNEEVVLTYKVTHGNTKDKNPTEAGDFADTVKIDEIITVRIPAGSSSASVSLPIVNDTVYEGAEGYTVTLVSVEGATKGKDVVETTIYDNGTTDGKTPNTPNPDPDKPRIEVDPPVHVSEEGLAGGRPDSNPVGVDQTNSRTSSGHIRLSNLENAEALKDTLLVKLTTAPTDVQYKGQPVTWVSNDAKSEWTAYVPNATQNDANRVLSIKLANNGSGTVDGDKLSYAYTVELFKNIDHPVKVDPANSTVGYEDNLDINFSVEVSEKATGRVLLNESKIVTVVEDDMPDQDTVVHNIQVAHDSIQLSNLVAGFTDTVMGRPSAIQDGVTIYNGYDAYLVGTNLTLVNRNTRVTEVTNANYARNNLNQLANTDTDNLDDQLAWGYSSNTTLNAGYVLEDNDLSQTNIKDLSESFTLGTFTHRNNSISPSYGTLFGTNLAVQFNVNINGQSTQTPLVKFALTHLETSNDTSNLQGVQSNDFVIVKNNREVIQVGNTVYRLVIDGLTKTGENIYNSAITAFNGLTNYAWKADSGVGALTDVEKMNLWNNNLNMWRATNKDGTAGKVMTLEDFAKAVGLPETDSNVINIYNLWKVAHTAAGGTETTKSVATTGNIANLKPAIQALFDAINGLTVGTATGNVSERVKANFIRTVLDGALITTVETTDNKFDVKAHLEPLIDPLDLETSVDIQGKIHIGADAPEAKTVKWIAVAGRDGVETVVYKNAAGAVVTDQTQAVSTEITTKYGLFTGKVDGNYSFKGVDNLSDVVAAGAKGAFNFNYNYTDTDGDLVTSSIKFDFDGLTNSAMSTARNQNGVGDTNDYFIGSTKAETINGNDGDDTIVGYGGADTLLGGRGNDVLFYDPEATINGGTSAVGNNRDTDNDTLSLAIFGQLNANKDGLLPIDLTTPAAYGKVTNIETVDMTNNMAQTLKISASAVLSMSDDLNRLIIKGDGSDIVQLDRSPVSTTQNQDNPYGNDGSKYTVYTYGSGANTATVYVESDMKVETIL